MEKPVVNLKKILQASNELSFAAKYCVWPQSYVESQLDQPPRKELENARDLINSVLVQYD